VIDRIDPEPPSSPGRAATGRGPHHHLPSRAQAVEAVSRNPGPAARWGMSSPAPLDRHNNCELTRAVVELAQRGRLILDVSSADLEAAEAVFGDFHPTTWHFRNSLNEARRSWERLRAEFGTKVLEAALSQPPLTTLTLGEQAKGSPRVILLLIGGKTYRAQHVTGTELAPVQWRLTRLLSLPARQPLDPVRLR
jgi:hypothetical protein